jgi:hypothetical protein
MKVVSQETATTTEHKAKVEEFVVYDSSVTNKGVNNNGAI